MAKVSKEKAQYQNEPSGNEQCSKCTMFRGPTGCTKVEEPVRSYGWCKYFYAK